MDSVMLTTHPGGNEPTSTHIPYGGYTVVAIGITVVVGGIFIALATYQLFPPHGNIISQLGIWGEVAGYGTIATGMVIIAIGSVLSGSNKPEEKIEEKNLNPKIEEIFASVADAIDDNVKKSLSVIFSDDFDVTSIYSHPDVVRYTEIVKLVEDPSWISPFAWVNISWKKTSTDTSLIIRPSLVIKLVDESTDKPAVVILCQKGKNVLKWYQDTLSYTTKEQKRPNFFGHQYFTDPLDGNLVEPLPGMGPLQLIAKGKPSFDRDGKKWCLYKRPQVSGEI